MAITLNTDAYADLTYADAYFAARLYATDWTAATDADKEAALIMAAQNGIDSYEYKGTRTDTITPQALKFPRSGLPSIDGVVYTNGVTPDEIKKANCEWALAYIKTSPYAQKNADKYKEVELPSGMRVVFTGVELDRQLTFSKTYLKPFLAAGSTNQASVAHG